MAICKFRFLSNLKKSVEYVTKERGEDDVVSSMNCDVETAADQFQNTKQLHDKMGGRQVFEMIQSFPPNERDMKTPEEFHEMGKALAQNLFPGFEAVVRTHTDKGHIHTHIRLNTVHPETGIRISNEKQWGQFFGPPKNKAALEQPEVAAFAAIYRASKEKENYQNKMVHVIRLENDKIVRDAGLSVPTGKEHERKAKMPQKVRDIEHARKESWVLDLMQKASFSRSLSTSYDEYAGYLREFNIGARVENKNITYTYPGTQKRVKRGKELGNLFDKDGLERNFANNDRMFAAKPEFRAELRQEFNALKSQPGHIVRDSSGVLLEPGGARTIFTKDYGAYKHTPRNGRASRSSSDLDLSESILPIGEVKRAKGSILDYCEKQKIALQSDAKGNLVLKGREYVHVRHDQFTNTRNNISGSLIDFVAIHQSLTYVQAISKINNNPRLLLLEQYWGEHKRNFNAFYVPKQERMERDKATSAVSNLFKSFGSSERAAKGIMARNQAHVSKAGAIRIFGENDGSGAIEFTENEKGTWNERKLGKMRKALYAAKPRGNTVSIFTDAKSFLAKHGDSVFGKGHAHPGVLALLTNEVEPVDHCLAEHHQVSKINLFFSGKKPTKEELDFFGVLKNHYQHHQVEVSMSAPEHEMPRKGHELSL